MSKIYIKKINIAPRNLNVAVIFSNVEYDYVELPVTVTVRLLDDGWRFTGDSFLKLYTSGDEAVFTAGLSDTVLTFSKTDDTTLTVTITEDENIYNNMSIFLVAQQIPGTPVEPDDEVYIISPSYIREQSNISSNIQDKFLQNAIQEVTNIDYRSLVGTKMLGRLKWLIYDEKINETDYIYYKHLLDYSKYYLQNMVTYRIMPLCAVKIDNIGNYTQNDEKIEPLDVDDTFRMANYYLKRADYYKKLIQQYILDNIENLPEVDEYTTNTINANLKSASMTNIWLGGRRGKIHNRRGYVKSTIRRD